MPPRNTSTSKPRTTTTKSKSKSKSKQPRSHRQKQPPFKVLVFSKTTSYRHESIPAGIRGIQRLADEISIQTHNPFTVEATEDASIFDSPSRLSTYRVIILLSNSGDDCLDHSQVKNFRDWVGEGGGVVGIHCATFACCSNEEYGDLLGGVFGDHPVPQTARVNVVVERPGDSVEEGEEDEYVLVKRHKGEDDGKDTRTRGFHPIHLWGEIGSGDLLKRWGKSSGDDSIEAGTTSGDGKEKKKESGDLKRKCGADEKEEESDSAADDDDDDDDDDGEESGGPSLSEPDEENTMIRHSIGNLERMSFLWHDEWYNFVNHPREKLTMLYNNGTTEDFTILLTVDESTYDGGKHGKDHPVAWCQEFPAPKTAEERKKKREGKSQINRELKKQDVPTDERPLRIQEEMDRKRKQQKEDKKVLPIGERGGRCFYTSLGHFDEAYEDPWFMGHVLGGIYWAAKVL